MIIASLIPPTLLAPMNTSSLSLSYPILPSCIPNSLLFADFCLPISSSPRKSKIILTPPFPYEQSPLPLAAPFGLTGGHFLHPFYQHFTIAELKQFSSSMKQWYDTTPEYYRYTSSSRKQRTMVSPYPKGEINNCLGIAADAWFNQTAYRL